MKINFPGRAALLRGLGFWRRGSAALPLASAIVLFFAVGAAAETTNTLSDAEIQGRQLAQQLLEQKPATNSGQEVVLHIRDGNGKHSDIPFLLTTIVTPTNWVMFYMSLSFSNQCSLIVGHADNKPNQYFSRKNELPGTNVIIVTNKTMIAFAGSDFWVADLGLEFFHWPEQKVLPKPTNLVRGREYTLLESTNPNPSTNGYSRVLSWIDKESGGILQAEAYDSNNKLFKEFYPKDFKKVNGQWQLETMEIRNVQTGSRTRFEFVDLGLGTTNSVDAASGLPQK